MKTKHKNDISLKAFLLKKTTLIGWLIFHFISIFAFTIIFQWSLLQSLFFVTFYGATGGDPSSTRELILQIIALLYFLISFLVYSFNLYPIVMKYLINPFRRN